MSNPRPCKIGGCENTAAFRVENKETGKVWEMCEWHKVNYTRVSAHRPTMVVIERIET